MRQLNLTNIVLIRQGAQGEPGSKGERGDPGLPVSIFFFFVNKVEN